MSEQKTYLGFKANLWVLLVVNALIVVALIWHFKSYEVDKEQEAILNKPVVKQPQAPEIKAPEVKVPKDIEIPKTPKKAVVKAKEIVVAKVPETAKVLKTHLVVEGDSYASLAAKLGMSSQDLYQLNHGMPLDTGVLIMLPDTQALTEVNPVKKSAIKEPKKIVQKEKKVIAAIEPKAQIQAVAIEPSKITYHTVAKGDTLYSISKKYNVSVAELIELNKLSSKQVNLGQQLTVTPVSTAKSEPLTVEVSELKVTPEQWHTVAKGDTLWGISQKYKVSVDDLIKLNSLGNNQVNIGQKLKVK